MGALLVSVVPDVGRTVVVIKNYPLLCQKRSCA